MANVEFKVCHLCSKREMWVYEIYENERADRWNDCREAYLQ